jgi:hypothetical protein
VYDTDVNDIIGLILAKDLIFVDAEVGLEWSLLGGFLYDFCDF